VGGAVAGEHVRQSFAIRSRAGNPLAPLRRTRFGNAFSRDRGGFAASTWLPPAPAELISRILWRVTRDERDGRVRHIVLEPCCGHLNVMSFVAAYVFVFGTDSRGPKSVAVTAVKRGREAPPPRSASRRWCSRPGGYTAKLGETLTRLGRGAP